jgi:hypothetical protein
MTELSPDLEYFKWINGVNNESRTFSAKDSDNNIYFLGTSLSPSITINNVIYERYTQLTNSLVLIKFSSSGNVLWLKWIESSSVFSFESITIYKNTDIYLSTTVATSNSIIYINGVSSGTSSNNNNSFIAKFTSNGAVSWLRFLITNGGNYIYSSTTDPSGNLYLVGTASINNPMTLRYNGIAYTKTVAGQDGYLIKINNDDTNSINFIKWIIGISTENIMNIALDRNNNIFITVYTYNPTSFNIDGVSYSTSISSDNTVGTFLIKFNANNTVSWVKSINGSGDEYPTDIKIDNSNNIILSGYTYSGTLNINGTSYQTTIVSVAIYLVKFDTNGTVSNFLWIEGNSADQSSVLQIDTNNNIYFTGYTVSSSLSINGTSYTKGGGAAKAGFAIKFNSNLQLRWIEWVSGVYSNNLKIILANSDNEIYLSGNTNLSTLKFKGVTYSRTGTDDASFLIKMSRPNNINFVVDEYITITQNAMLATNVPITTLNIDYSLSLEVNNLIDLFNITYQQNSLNAEMYDINVVMNNILMNQYLNDIQNWSISKLNNNVVSVGLTNTNELPKALLETIALRVFGSGNARAVIVNDYSINESVLSHTNDFYYYFNNRRNQFFQAYVASGRISGGDVSQSATMNLNNTRLSFPMYVTGKMFDSTGNDLILNPYIDGYSSYNGYGTMSNGVYNIPVIIRFHQN